MYFPPFICSSSPGRLHPLNSQQRGLAICSAVDPAKETEGARGLVIAQIFPLKPDGLKTVTAQETLFAGYRAVGAHEAGLLATLDMPNNFPQLPIRTDGPYLVSLVGHPERQ